MHAASYPPNDAATGDGEQTSADDASRRDLSAAQQPGDEPLHAVAEAPQQRPIMGFFTRRAFLSKDTGRWHRLTGGRDDDRDAEGGG
jgi:hypothetical protein